MYQPLTHQRLPSCAKLGPVVGYVSDERYLAVPGVYLEISGADGQRYSATSTATGAVCIDLPSGTYDVALNLVGYGAKVCDEQQAYQDLCHSTVG